MIVNNGLGRAWKEMECLRKKKASVRITGLWAKKIGDLGSQL
jgi:hypothetical protein